MRDSYLSIEIFDADTRFHFATCKVPLYELLRQQRGEASRAKECDVCAPDDASEIRGTLQLVMSNEGHSPHDKYV